MAAEGADSQHRGIGKFFIILALLSVIFGGGYYFGRKHSKMPPIIQRDTLIRVDTFKAVECREIAHYIRVHDTIKVPVIERATDTLWLDVPREVREYKDTAYFARVSGIAPRLDYIETYNKTTTITEVRQMPAPRLSFGVQAGVGLQYGLVHKAPDIGAYVGVGVQYRFGAK